MKVIFIARAYPPIRGGIEHQNYGLSKALSKITEVKILPNRKGKKFLPIFVPWVTLKSFFLIPKYDAVLLGDGVLSPVCAFLKFFYPHKKYFCIIHGLDITFARKKSFLGKIYRAVNIPALKKFTRLIMVGNQTIEEAVRIGIPREKCTFIPNGIDSADICELHERSELEKLLGENLDHKKVMVRIGRYVKHKGLEWFIRNAMPRLPEEYILVAAGSVVARKTAGDKNYFPACERAVKEKKLEKRVKLLTNLSWKNMKIIFNTADLFVLPNIAVPGSMEGFGINAIEGAACGKIVIASRIEGHKDAIVDGENGFFVEPGDAEGFVRKIKELLSDPDFQRDFREKAQKYTIDHFSWDKIAHRYLEVFRTAE